MKVTRTAIPDVLILAPQVHGDPRGFFLESWNAKTFEEAVGHSVTFVQDNHARSSYGVLRGLHYQIGQPQGKLVRVVRGRVFDVAVDLRRSSPTFRRWVGVELSEDNHCQLWAPGGFAHGYMVLSDSADVLYKATDFWALAAERFLRWDDPAIGIAWPAGIAPILSAKDRAAPPLDKADVFD